MNFNFPTVSALMVTHPKKKAYVEESIESFSNQSYPKRKLLILNTEIDNDYQTYLESLAEKYTDVEIIDESPKSTLGGNRNLLLSMATSEIVMTWDDDDLSHPKRIELQLNAMLRGDKRFSFITSYCHLFEKIESVFVVERLNNPSAISSGNVDLDEILENTMMGYTEDVKAFRYSNENSGEDSPLNKSILDTKKVDFLSGKPHLFTYRFCGSNVWGSNHHMSMVKKSKEVFFRLKNDITLLDYYPRRYKSLSFKNTKFQQMALLRSGILQFFS